MQHRQEHVAQVPVPVCAQHHCGAQAEIYAMQAVVGSDEERKAVQDKFASRRGLRPVTIYSVLHGSIDNTL